MKEQNNKLTLSVMLTLITGIALIYTLIIYPHILFAVLGMSILFFIASYFLTVNLISFSIKKNKSLNSHIKDCIDDLSAQLDAINKSNSQIEKATYLQVKQVAKSIATLENNYTEAQASLFKNMTTFSEMQNKSTKVMIKYNQSNTNQLISTLKDMRNHLNETMVHGFDQIQPNNEELLSVLNEIVTYFKSNSENIDHSIGLPLNNLATELQNISNNTTPETDLASENDLSEKNANDMLSPDEIAALFAAAEPTPNKESKSDPSEIINDSSVKETEKPFKPTFTVVNNPPTEVEQEITNTESIDNPPIATVGEIIDDPNKQLSQEEIAALFANTTSADKQKETSISTEVPNSDDPNKQLSPDEIAALFASLG